ncbi:MAG: response regulator [Vicinamibacterales bacterium]
MNERILIVEDEAPIRRLMAMALESSGYDVTSAEDGPSGLAHFADGSGWRAVLLDQRMPGMEGLEVLRRIKAINTAVPVIMVTAFPSIDLAVDAMKLGAVDFLRKPLTPDVLRSAVAAAMRSRGAGAARPSPRPDTHPMPNIEMITMNGFRIVHEGSSGQDYHFRVFEGAGETGTPVVVTITADAAASVESLLKRRFEPGSGYWQVLAEDLLAAHLWREQRLPVEPLVIRQLSAVDLEAAAFWPGGS